MILLNGKQFFFFFDHSFRVQAQYHTTHITERYDVSVDDGGREYLTNIVDIIYILSAESCCYLMASRRSVFYIIVTLYNNNNILYKHTIHMTDPIVLFSSPSDRGYEMFEGTHRSHVPWKIHKT